MGRLTWRCTALPTTRCPTLCGWCTVPATWPCCVMERTILRLVSLMWVTTQQTVHEFCLTSAWAYLYLQSKMEAGSSTWATHCQWVLFRHLPLWFEWRQPHWCLSPPNNTLSVGFVWTPPTLRGELSKLRPAPFMLVTTQQYTVSRFCLDASHFALRAV